MRNVYEPSINKLFPSDKSTFPADYDATIKQAIAKKQAKPNFDVMIKFIREIFETLNPELRPGRFNSISITI
jgi:hypothetical protein